MPSYRRVHAVLRPTGILGIILSGLALVWKFVGNASNIHFLVQIGSWLGKDQMDFLSTWGPWITGPVGLGLIVGTIAIQDYRDSHLPVGVQATVLPEVDRSAPPHDMLYISLTNVDLTNASSKRAMSLELRLAWGKATGQQVRSRESPRFDLRPEEHTRIDKLRFYLGTIDSASHGERLFEMRPFLFVEDHVSGNTKMLTEREFGRDRFRLGPEV